MSRQLNKAQQKILISAVTNRDIYSTDGLTLEEMERLEKLNDHETLWQNANRFIHDYLMSKLN
jgi:hypothetical protein